MSFGDIMGQETAKQMLQSGLRQEAISHAYLFSGPAGSGQRQMATAFAQAIYCTRQQDDACGECLECRKVEHGNHPDLYYVEPEGASLKIDQIRELQKIFNYRSENNNCKIYIIDQADKMTTQAANSLLKFLEEPQVPAVGILITSNKGAMLPTILSRTQEVPFKALSPERISEALVKEGYSPALVRTAAFLSSGLETCRELLDQNWFAEIRNVMLQLGGESLTRGSMALVSAQQKLFKSGLSEHLELMFDMFHLWFKDMLYVSYGKQENVIFIDQLSNISTIAMSRSTEQWVSYMDLAAECRKKLRSNMNGQLCVEQFLIGLAS